MLGSRRCFCGGVGYHVGESVRFSPERTGEAGRAVMEKFALFWALWAVGCVLAGLYATVHNQIS
jgi:hypothetical protein